MNHRKSATIQKIFLLLIYCIFIPLSEVVSQQLKVNQFNDGNLGNFSRDFNREKNRGRYENQSPFLESQMDKNPTFNEIPNRFGYSRNPNVQNFYTYSTGNYDFGETTDPDEFCPEHWKAFRQACYRFVKSPRHTWHEARKLCQAYKADLVNVDSVEKQKFLTRELYLDNQVQNRYFISARQTSPGQYVNEDNTQLFTVEDSFSYEEPETGDENFNQWSMNTDNHFFRTNNNGNGYSNSILIQNNKSPNTYNIYDDRIYNKDRVVYGYSHKKDRWLFMTAFDFEPNLFICESQTLYSPENIEKRMESSREIDYGIEFTDPETMPRGPYFITQPKDTIYDTGKLDITNYVTITSLAGGFPTPTYSWYKEVYVNDNLTFIMIDPLTNPRHIISGGNLIITDPNQSEDQGTYHCVAENKFGRIISESVQLDFGFISEFNLKRANETGATHWGKALFCDPPTYYPAVKYYWALDFFPQFVDEDERTFVSYDGALYFSALEPIDEGMYSCSVQMQSLGSDTGRNGPFFFLDVVSQPNYQSLVFANTFPKVFPEAPIAGEDIRLECMAFGYPYPISYNWTRKSSPLPKNSRIENFDRVLIIKNATVNDNGEYSCTISNVDKKIEKSVYINVQIRPNFTIPLKDQVRDFNSEVNFVCEANAIPDANYTWYKNAELLDWDQLDRDKYIIQDNILNIKFLDPEKDDGMYQCKATNQLKGTYSAAQLRVVSMKPTFKKRPLETEMYAALNGNITIHCDPEAAPRPKFTWKKDGISMGTGNNRRILPDGSLFISPVMRDDGGVYTCVATNAYGTDESSANLIILEEIRFYQTLQPQIVAEVGQFLYLQCNVEHDPILDVALVWTHNGQTIHSYYNNYLEDEEVVNIRPRFYVNYQGLEINNVSQVDVGTYECIAKSSVNEISSRTNLVVLGPPSKCGGVKVLDIKKKTAELEWIDGSSNGSPVMYYNIYARTNWNKTWVKIAENVEATDSDRYTGRKQANIDNLTPYCSYEFIVTAVNYLGESPPSASSPSHNTLHDKPYIFPRNVRGGGGKIGDLIITWDPLLPEEQNSLGIYYKVFYRLHGRIGQTEWASKNLSTYGNVGQAVIQIPFEYYYTQYDVKVQAFNDQGEGPISDVVVIYSAEDMPQVAPQGVISAAFNSTSINVTWNAVDESRETMRGKLLGYRLKYWVAGRNEEDAIYYLSRTTRTWALIVGLEVDQYYFAKVMAYNAAGEGPESERFYESTFRAAPQKPPEAVHVFGINPSTIRVVWRYVSPSQDEEPIKGFKIRIWEAEQDMSTAIDHIHLVGNTLEHFIDTLTPGKAYRLRILAYSNGGDGRMSSPVIIFQMGITKSPFNSSTSICLSNLLKILLSVILLHLYSKHLYNKT